MGTGKFGREKWPGTGHRLITGQVIVVGSEFQCRGTKTTGKHGNLS